MKPSVTYTNQFGFGHIGLEAHWQVLYLPLDLFQFAAGSDAQASARSAIAELPPQLDRVAACCAVYFFMQHSDEEALRQLKGAVTAMQHLLQEARLALA